jgi:voltage-gated potassium channel
LRKAEMVSRVLIIAIVVLGGALNIADGTSYLARYHGIADTALTDLSGHLRIVGHGTQTVLGASLIVSAIGLGLRVRAAWAFALLLSFVLLMINVAQYQFGASLIVPGILLVALYFSRGEFYRRTAYVGYFVSALAIAVVLTYGVIGSQILGAGFNPPIQGGLTGLYYTLMTLSTVGYGDIVPVTAQARVFAMTLVVFGIGIFVSAVVSSIGPAFAGQLGRIVRMEKTQMVLKDHVIIVGGGAVAENTARELAQRKIEYVRITEATTENPDTPAIVGDPTEEGVLQSAGIANARMLIAARESDSDNAFVALLAKDLNPKVKVLVVARNERSIPRLKLARADVVFAPSVVGGRLIANLVEGRTIPAEFGDLVEQTLADS